MKHIRATIVVVIIVIIIALIVAFSPKATAPVKESQQTASATPTVTVPSGWKAYKGAGGTITFNAPADFVPQDGEDTFTLEIPAAAPYANTHLFRDGKITVTGDECKLDNQYPSEEKVVNGVTFVRQDKQNAGAGNLYRTISYTEMRDHCITFEMFVHTTNGEGLYTDNEEQIKTVDAQHAKDIQSLVKLFDEIASTIQFIK